ncbi:MAG: aldo/keto reductase [Spongiibacteraceae bacterium]|jgi:aryl-alcohol dehydrogenase-like predicted oxidoreductase|nr:aldo/keto reductase [Spongiibacteraceae bacterium]
MHSRRRFLASTLAASAALIASRALGQLDTDRTMAMRAIPATGEELPVIGMGTSGSFEVGTDAAARAPLLEVLQRFFAGGGRLIDTAPSYGPAEDVLGDLLTAGNHYPQTFMATKVSVVGRDAGLAQFQRSLERLQTDKVDLLQVHNLRDWKTQLALLRELKAEGKTRYIGLTHYLDSAHDELADIVQAEKPDFLQINYSVVSRNVERRLLPLAQDLGVAVLINRAFEDGRLFREVTGTPVPEPLRETGVTTWAQAFLKFALSHPAVTTVIPATGKPDRQSDNLKAGFGPDLDEAQRRALIAVFA